MNQKILVVIEFISAMLLLWIGMWRLTIYVSRRARQSVCCVCHKRVLNVWGIRARLRKGVVRVKNSGTVSYYCERCKDWVAEDLAKEVRAWFSKHVDTSGPGPAEPPPRLPPKEDDVEVVQMKPGYVCLTPGEIERIRILLIDELDYAKSLPKVPMGIDPDSGDLINQLEALIRKLDAAEGGNDAQ